MRRNRSPVRYLPQDKSREKSFSISSLSDCSLGRSPKRYSQDDTADEKRTRSYRVGHYKRDSSHRDYDKGFERRGRKVSRSRSREKESQILKSSKNRELKEKSYSSGTSHKKPMHDNFDQKSQYTDPDKKEKPNDRLQRLEQMVELLVSSKASQSKETPTSSNFGEFNPRSTYCTTSMWLNKINEECIEKNFRETDCIQYTQSKMTGLMKAWFKTLDLFDYTWPEIKMLIINTFPDNVDFAATLRLLVNRFKKPEETITQYYFSKMYLLEACKITGANAVSCLIDGLNEPYWQRDAKVQNFQNPELLYAEFLSKLPNFGMQQVISEGYPHKQVQEQAPLAYEYVEQIYEPKTSDYRVHSVEDLRQNIGISRLEKLARKDSQKKCFICSGVNHLAAKCPKNNKCFLCMKPGHIAANCLTAK